MDEIEELLQKIPAPEPNLEFETKFPHRKFFTVEYTDGGSYDVPREQIMNLARREEADLVSSETVDGNHAPAIDIDLPCRLVESSTPQHFHLYIDKPMPWKQYKKLLKALVKAGIVERGYYHMAKRKKASFLRVEGKPKSESRVTRPYGGGYW